MTVRSFEPSPALTTITRLSARARKGNNAREEESSGELVHFLSQRRYWRRQNIRLPLLRPLGVRLGFRILRCWTQIPCDHGTSWFGRLCSEAFVKLREHRSASPAPGLPARPVHPSSLRSPRYTRKDLECTRRDLGNSKYHVSRRRAIPAHGSFGQSIPSTFRGCPCFAPGNMRPRR